MRNESSEALIKSKLSSPIYDKFNSINESSIIHIYQPNEAWNRYRDVSMPKRNRASIITVGKLI